MKKDNTRSLVRFVLPLGFVVAVLLALTAAMLQSKYERYQSLQELHNGMYLATYISRLIHATQKERGMSSGYLAGKDDAFANLLRRQRKETDARIEALYKALQNEEDDTLRKKIVDVLHELGKLDMMRADIDARRVSIRDNLRYYSHINDRFLRLLVEISKVSEIPLITQGYIAYINFLYAKEHAGLERAVGTTLLSGENAMYAYFVELVAKQDVYLKTFENYAPNAMRMYFLMLQRTEAFREVARLQEQMIRHEKVAVLPMQWFDVITQKINRMEAVEDKLERELAASIDQERRKTFEALTLLILLNVLSFASLMFIGMYVLRLFKSEKRLRTITDRYIISSTTDTKGRITDASDAFCAISGYTKEELIGKPHNIIRHPDMPKAVFKEMWRTIKQGKVWQGKIKNRKKDGGYYWVFANIEPLFDRKGNIEGYAAIRLDITDSVHLEEELRRSKEKDETILHQGRLAQMGEMISMIAHQWRQPLGAIAATSSDLYMKTKRGRFDEAYFISRLQRIDKYAKYLSQTIDDFRNFYKKDQERQCVRFTQVIEDALGIIGSSLNNKHIEVERQYESDAYVFVLANELRQVVLNLLKNAEDVLIDRGVEKPNIRLKTYVKDQKVYFEVADNGGGVKVEKLHTIFEPYFSTKSKKDGTGLGLYMSKMIVEEHCNGDISVRNDTHGAVFTIILPKSDCHKEG